MGKHFSPKELDVIHAGGGATAVERALKGKTFQRARVEPRGRKAVLTQLNLRTLDATRKRLIAKAKGEYEVHWDDVIHAARVPTVHRTTAARALSEAGYGIEWRTPRLKPDRSDMDEEQRTDMCDKYRLDGQGGRVHRLQEVAHTTQHSWARDGSL